MHSQRRRNDSRSSCVSAVSAIAHKTCSLHSLTKRLKSLFKCVMDRTSLDWDHLFKNGPFYVTSAVHIQICIQANVLICWINNIFQVSHLWLLSVPNRTECRHHLYWLYHCPVILFLSFSFFINYLLLFSFYLFSYFYFYFFYFFHIYFVLIIYCCYLFFSLFLLLSFSFSLLIVIFFLSFVVVVVFIYFL